MPDPPSGHVVLWEIPRPANTMDHGPIARHVGDLLTISYDYEAPSGDYRWEELTFSGVIAFGFTDGFSSSVDAMKAWYRLVEIRASTWLHQLTAERRIPTPGVRHMRIYFDDVGAWDVAATSFCAPPARRPEPQ